MCRHTKTLNTVHEFCEAAKPAFGKRLCAVLVHKGIIISVGFNQKKTHPFQKKHSKNNDAIWIHAENDCLVRAMHHHNKETIRKSTLYVLRLKQDQNGNLIRGMAKPCSGCQRAIAASNIQKICYTTDDAEFDWL